MNAAELPAMEGAAVVVGVSGSMGVELPKTTWLSGLSGLTLSNTPDDARRLVDRPSDSSGMISAIDFGVYYAQVVV